MHLADACIQSDLQCIQSIYFFLSVHVFTGNRTHNLCAANAMLYHWATGTGFELFSSHFSSSTFQLVPKATFLIFKILIEYLFDFISALFSINKTVFNSCIYIKW